jgi:hypothetical protein
MVPRILLSLILSAPITMMAQYMTTAPNGQLAPAGSIMVVGNGGGPALSTPSLTFGTPAPTAGISLADRAGISNVAPTVQGVPSYPESVPVYSNVTPAGVNGYANGYAATGESTAVTAANAATSGRLINDLGPSYYAGTGTVSGGAGPSGTSTAMNAVSGASLGEIAAQYKSARPQNIRTYTNADAQRLSDSMNVHGANINPVNAQNTPPATTQTQTQAQVAGAQPATPTTQPQLSAGMRPSPAIRGDMTQSTSGTQSSSAAQSTTSTSSDSTAQANQSGATTPQVAEQSGRSKDKDQETGKQLPASSTLLPLFGLLGLACGGIGMWLRKYRR